MDVKTYLCNDHITQIGKDYSGVLNRDSDDHYTFVEDAPKENLITMVRRSPHIYKGTCVNVVRRADGNLYPTFNRPKYSEGFGFQDFCKAATHELLTISCLLGEKVAT